MKKILITFYTEDYSIAKKSLIKSAHNYFDEILEYTPEYIDSDFAIKNKNILKEKKGAGYWLWKPYFIYKTLLDCEYGDSVFYVDAGNIFVNNPNEIFNYIQNENDIILFDNRDGMTNGDSARNYISCKKDCFVLMGCDSDKYINGLHLNASYQIYKKSKNSLDFVYEYLIFCQNENILKDSDNLFGSNYSGYYDHRHDQSVLSLLAIKYDIKPLVDPSEWGNKCGCRGFNQIFLHHRNKNFEL
jgi:hypothetical protein